MSSLLQLAAVLVAVILMFAVGASMRPRSLREALANPARLLVLVGGQLVLVPLVGVGLSWFLARSPHAAGATLWILLLASCPGGAISNAIVLYGRGDVALSVVMTATTSVLAAATMPVLLLSLHAVGAVPPLEVPVMSLVGQAFGLLLAPCAAGMLTRAVAGESAERLVRRVGALGAALLALTLALAIAEHREALQAIWKPASLSAVLFVIVAGCLGEALARTLRLDAAGRFTVMVEFAVRNVAAAFAISILSFGRDDFAAFGAVYLVSEVTILTIIATRRRRARASFAAVASAPSSRG